MTTIMRIANILLRITFTAALVPIAIFSVLCGLVVSVILLTFIYELIVSHLPAVFILTTVVTAVAVRRLAL